MALSKQEKKVVFKDFGTSANDTGSTEVQIALLTKDILLLTTHCQKHPKDNSTKRGLIKKVSQRRRLSSYLKGNDVAKYKAVIAQLGLRK